MPVTLRQIASHHGVSLQTVSQAINGKGQLRDQTRRAILKTADELGYRPNASARSMRHGRRGTIGILVNAATSFTASILAPIARESQARGLKVMVDLLTPPGSFPGSSPAPENAAGPASIADLPGNVQMATLTPLLSELTVDGLIMMPQAQPQVMRRQLARMEMPAIWMYANDAVDAVSVLSRDAGRRATERLLAAGHRRIAFADCSGNAQRVTAGRPVVIAHEYVLGYADAMRAAGLQPRMLPEGIDESIAFDDRARAAAQWLTQPDRPTAIIAAAYSTALPLYFAATSDARLHVPTDLSIIVVSAGIAERVAIPFTRLAVPETEMGAAAINMLLARMDNSNIPAPSVQLTVPLIEGRTVAPPCSED